MKKSALRKKAKDLIDSGVSHNEAYIALKADEEKPKPSDILKILKQIPSLTKRKKYAGIRMALLIMIGVNTLTVAAYGGLLYLQGMSIGAFVIIVGLAINTAIFIGVYRYAIQGFRSLAILTVIGWLRSFAEMDFSDPITIGALLFSAALVGLSGFMTVKLEMKYNKVPVMEVGDDGVERRVTKVLFEKEAKQYSVDVIDETI